jgi:hypothetical protein
MLLMAENKSALGRASTGKAGPPGQLLHNKQNGEYNPTYDLTSCFCQTEFIERWRLRVGELPSIIVIKME